MDLDYINLNNLTDAETAERMRSCNYEKFKSLVRMHLSFELDLNTDEFDLPCHEIIYEEKGKLKKWNRLSKKHRSHLSVGTTGCAATVRGTVTTSNSPPDNFQQHIDAGFLLHIEKLKGFLLLEKNVTQEGIFRKTGSMSRQQELRLQIQQDQCLDLEGGGYSVHDCATVFKGYLSELPEPLLTDAHYPAYLQIAPLCIGSALNVPTHNANVSTLKPPHPERVKRDQQLLNSVQFLLLLLPEENRKLLKHVIEILHIVASYHMQNKMSPQNLATLFAPHLICPRNLPPEALHYVAKQMSGVIAYMVIRGTEIFEVPAKLATDIRAYFLERKRKKTMSPEQTLDDSASDISTVNTVYTFVDRERTAAAHTANTTDTELAQLYAHIQSLPESSKKRRLIKQFNKQNGQGTPLQLVVMNRLKNTDSVRSAKSIGDTIKKHIFHKGIMSRTPKRPATAVIPNCLETPSCSSSVKYPKFRVLFESPTPTSSQKASVTAVAHRTNFTPCLKTHPLQKSISSTTLRLNMSSSSSSSSTTSLNCHQHASNSTHLLSHELEPSSSSSSSCNSEAFPSQKPSESTIVSTVRTGGNSVQPLHLFDTNCCTTPLKPISEAAKHLLGMNSSGSCSESASRDVGDGRNDGHLMQINEEQHTPEQDAFQSQCVQTEFKSRYKSEPDLSCTRQEKFNTVLQDACEHTPLFRGGKAFTRKLIKGVSMGNLKLSIGPHEATRNLVRSVSSTLRNRISDENTYRFCRNTAATPLLEDLDDETFEDQSVDSGSDDESVGVGEDGVESEVEVGERVVPQINKYVLLQPSNVNRNLNLITSTPSLLLGRRSMSPITKSTQRMPKAMQESIMTPRSRKPVMVFATALSSSDQNQTVCQADSVSCREENEVEREEGTEQSLIGRVGEIVSNKPNTNPNYGQNKNTLTHGFKEYLLSRSVLTASPVDSSFSSQPDDFQDSLQDMENLDESQLSPSLLYCLDGNQPDSVEPEVEDSNKPTHFPSTSTAEHAPNAYPFAVFNNVRKRAAITDVEKVSTITSTAQSIGIGSNKENREGVTGYHLLTKKSLIRDYPGETSF